MHDMIKNKKEITNKKLIDYIDLLTLKKILNTFTTTTGLNANIVEPNGKSIFSKNDIKECCKFCRIIFGLDNGLERCQSAYERAGKQSAIFKEPYIFRCPSGLMEFAAPIIVDGEHVGTIICGQVLMWEPEDFFWIELREMNKDLNVDYEELFQSVKELPTLSGHQVQAASYLLYLVTDYITNAGWKNYQQAKAVEVSQSLLYEEIKNRKNLEKQFKIKNNDNLQIKENIIIEAFLNINEGNEDLFQKLIATFRFESQYNIPVFRMRCVELIILVTRALEKIGTSIKNFAQFADEALTQLYSAENEEDMILIVNSLIDNFIKIVRNKNDITMNINVRAMISFIDENYQKSLSLENIAENAELSSSYASRLFKKSMGMSITDYIIQVRLENAKKYLINPHYQIEEIASKVGYDDSSYFTKIFRKYEGITPSQFRKNKN